MVQPILPSEALETLTRQRLVELYKELGLEVPPASWNKGACVRDLLKVGEHYKGLDVVGFLSLLHREELKTLCRQREADDTGRSRAELAARLVGHHVDPDAFRVVTSRQVVEGSAPQVGDIVQARLRNHLVRDLHRDPLSQTHRVDLVCIDDDDQGRETVVVWEGELGARVIQSNDGSLGVIQALDDPRNFAAYLQAVRWQAVTAADAEIFQAPFRAGIQHTPYQMTALMKALSLPRVNLFIADDVGLGKTIEAGLVTLELMLRQRVDWVLVVCPPSVGPQWQDELSQRFGLDFSLYSRDFVRRARMNRGFHTNPWSTHNRFIVSYHLLRRPEHREPLLQFLSDRVPKSLLIMDEAHTVAPSSAATRGGARARYAVDSQLTGVARQLAGRFEHRLFLSATPHNGHSNSFSALLELLDPHRFTRGIPITDPAAELAPVMVRRLKADLRELGEEKSFADRKIMSIELIHVVEQGYWQEMVRVDGQVTQAFTRLPGYLGPNLDEKLATAFREYANLETHQGKIRAVMVQLQKRLLSSTAAFKASIERHAQSSWAHDQQVLTLRQGPDARQTLDDLIDLARRAALQPEAKLLSLMRWVDNEMTPGASWSARRLLVFTEYTETLEYIKKHLEQAIEGTDQCHHRIEVFSGDTDEFERKRIKDAFNGDPDEHPVRILLATDAAREGINLHARCHHVLHYDLPWNPARLEQRNGRVDRKNQESPEVFCMYFKYLRREEDQILETLILKTETIRRELGSLGAVIAEEASELLEEGGLTATARRYLESSDTLRSEATRNTYEELEKGRREIISAELTAAKKRLDMSRKRIHWSPRSLMTVVDTGCRLATGSAGLKPVASEGEGVVDTYELPALTKDWWPLIDPIRPAREDDQQIWDWRRSTPPRPVVFQAPESIRRDVYQLHLQHPFVRRILGMFQAAGFGAFGLSRVTAIALDEPTWRYAVGFARLVIHNGEGGRLHDQWLTVVGSIDAVDDNPEMTVLEDGSSGDLRAMKYLESALAAPEQLRPVSPALTQRLCRRASADYDKLWPQLREEADVESRRAEQGLKARADKEAADLRQILERKKAKLSNSLQTTVEEGIMSEPEQTQLRFDREFWKRELEGVDAAIDTEPDSLGELYAVALRRVEPVGLVYLWGQS